MGRTTPLPFAGVAAVAAVAVACGGGGDPPAPGATVGTAPTTTTTPADLAVVPPEARIDEGYVQAVVDALYAVDAGATRIFVETRALDQRAIDHLAAIYVEDE
ncbi:MAG: hypothetical protein ACRDZ9_00030, partial [Acidimicrobiales bacterium]